MPWQPGKEKGTGKKNGEKKGRKMGKGKGQKLQAIYILLCKRECKTAKIKKYKHKHYALAQTFISGY